MAHPPIFWRKKNIHRYVIHCWPSSKLCKLVGPKPQKKSYAYYFLIWGFNWKISSKSEINLGVSSKKNQINDFQKFTFIHYYFKKITAVMLSRISVQILWWNGWKNVVFENYQPVQKVSILIRADRKNYYMIDNKGTFLQISQI